MAPKAPSSQPIIRQASFESSKISSTISSKDLQDLESSFTVIIPQTQLKLEIQKHEIPQRHKSAYP
jgi:hypothetical protein